MSDRTKIAAKVKDLNNLIDFFQTFAEYDVDDDLRLTGDECIAVETAEGLTPSGTVSEVAPECEIGIDKWLKLFGEDRFAQRLNLLFNDRGKSFTAVLKKTQKGLIPDQPWGVSALYTLALHVAADDLYGSFANPIETVAEWHNALAEMGFEGMMTLDFIINIIPYLPKEIKPADFLRDYDSLQNIIGTDRIDSKIIILHLMLASAIDFDSPEKVAQFIKHLPKILKFAKKEGLSNEMIGWLIGNINEHKIFYTVDDNGESSSDTRRFFEEIAQLKKRGFSDDEIYYFLLDLFPTVINAETRGSTDTCFMLRRRGWREQPEYGKCPLHVVG